MDGLGRGRFKMNEWLEKYNLWFGEMTWNCDGSKNSSTLASSQKKKVFNKQFLLHFLIISLYALLYSVLTFNNIISRVGYFINKNL